MKTKEIIKLIEADGWFEVRQKGSHRQFKHPVKKGLITVPVHRLSNDLTPGLRGAY
jgi:predicted RNA binding protein YcfA (HicA-like mRNA interferase family)